MSERRRRPSIERYKIKMISALRGPEGMDEGRLDWDGFREAMAIYDRSSVNRDRVIGAMGRIINQAKVEPKILAQVVDLVTALDVTQLEPNIQRLSRRSVSQQDPVREAVNNFQSSRQLRRDFVLGRF